MSEGRAALQGIKDPSVHLSIPWMESLGYTNGWQKEKLQGCKTLLNMLKSDRGTMWPVEIVAICM